MLHLPCQHPPGGSIQHRNGAIQPSRDLNLEAFKTYWSNIVYPEYKPRVGEVSVVAARLLNVSYELEDFVVHQLDLMHQRDDYHEQLEMIFLKGRPPRGAFFQETLCRSLCKFHSLMEMCFKNLNF